MKRCLLLEGHWKAFKACIPSQHSNLELVTKASLFFTLQVVHAPQARNYALPMDPFISAMFTPRDDSQSIYVLPVEAVHFLAVASSIAIGYPVQAMMDLAIPATEAVTARMQAASTSDITIGATVQHVPLGGVQAFMYTDGNKTTFTVTCL